MNTRSQNTHPVTPYSSRRYSQTVLKKPRKKSPKMPHPNTPVIIGVADIKNRSTHISAAKEPATLMLEAIQAALSDASASSTAQLQDAIDSIDVVRTWTWPYPDLPGLLATRLQVQDHVRWTRYSEHGGDKPGKCVDEAARRVARRECSVAVVTGGEALASCELSFSYFYFFLHFDFLSLYLFISWYPRSFLYERWREYVYAQRADFPFYTLVSACAAAKKLPPPGWTPPASAVDSVFSPTGRDLGKSLYCSSSRALLLLLMFLKISGLSMESGPRYTCILCMRMGSARIAARRPRRTMKRARGCMLSLRVSRRRTRLRGITARRRVKRKLQRLGGRIE